MQIEKQTWGKTDRGESVTRYTLTNKSGASISVLDFGAILQAVCVPDQNGNMRDVVLGYDDIASYEANPYFFGSIIGRNGNRINKGKFTIDGKSYQMPINENDNNLHSGPDGFEKRMWAVSRTDENTNEITLSLTSPDGDQGFPGIFQVQVTYALSEDNTLSIHYQGKCDHATVANMTNHSYFNLGGHDGGSVMEHQMQLMARSYTPVIDPKSIPTGEIAPVAGTPMDFTAPTAIGARIGDDFEQLAFTGGYDHNYVYGDPGKEKVTAEVTCPKTGISMKVTTDLPGMQFYAGNFIGSRGLTNGKAGAVYDKRHGFCLETQYYPDAVNQKGFPSPVLAANAAYDTKTSYHFSVERS